MTVPVAFRWTGEAMEPVSPFWARKADEVYIIGETYRLDEWRDRSIKSHSHYFASLSDAYANLPEQHSIRFASFDHFRKRGLVLTGWRDEAQIVCASDAEAFRLAAMIKDMDDFSVVSVNGPVVVRWTAKSQSMRAMGKADFQQSKDDVLGWAWALCGLTPEEAAPHAGRAA